MQIYSAKRSPDAKMSWTLTCSFKILHIRVCIYHKDHIMIFIIDNLLNCSFLNGTCKTFLHVYILFYAYCWMCRIGVADADKIGVWITKTARTLQLLTETYQTTNHKVFLDKIYNFLKIICKFIQRKGHQMLTGHELWPVPIIYCIYIYGFLFITNTI